MGPLVGHAFATAIAAYADASGAAGGAAALAQGLSPLDGIVVPTLGAYAIAATLLLPFVALSIVAREKESGAHTLLAQAPVPLWAQCIIKVKTLSLIWVLSWTPGIVALVLWHNAGGHLDASETLGVFAGHLLHGVLVVSLGVAAAAVTESAGSAAVLALAVTLGGWALEFAGQVQGGLVARLAAFAPDAVLRGAEHGELSASVVVVTIVGIFALLGLAVVWLEPARARYGGVIQSAVALGLAAVLALGASTVRASWDLTEDRRNSFDRADAAALATIQYPLTVTVHLAPEDPRYADLERGVLRKLRHTMHDVRVNVVSRTGTGLFERDSSYGEVWYDVRGRRGVSRSTTVPIVLETVYGLAGVTPPSAHGDSAYPGYPQRVPPSSGALFFYIIWPLAVALVWWGNRRRRSP